MNKKQKTTAKLTAGGIGLVVLSALLTVGGIRLFSHEKKGDKVLENLLHIEFNADFFKNCKETTETLNGQPYQLLTYTVPKTDYVVEISNWNPTETPFDFETSLKFHSGPQFATLRIANIDAKLIEFSGENDKKEVVEEIRLMRVESTTLADGSKKLKSIYATDQGNMLDEIVKLKSFTVYGNEIEEEKK